MYKGKPVYFREMHYLSLLDLVNYIKDNDLYEIEPYDFYMDYFGVDINRKCKQFICGHTECISIARKIAIKFMDTIKKVISFTDTIRKDYVFNITPDNVCFGDKVICDFGDYTKGTCSFKDAFAPFFHFIFAHYFEMQLHTLLYTKTDIYNLEKFEDFLDCYKIPDMLPGVKFHFSPPKPSGLDYKTSMTSLLHEAYNTHACYLYQCFLKPYEIFVEGSYPGYGLVKDYETNLSVSRIDDLIKINKQRTAIDVVRSGTNMSNIWLHEYTHPEVVPSCPECELLVSTYTAKNRNYHKNFTFFGFYNGLEPQSYKDDLITRNCFYDVELIKRIEKHKWIDVEGVERTIRIADGNTLPIIEHCEPNTFAMNSSMVVGIPSDIKSDLELYDLNQPVSISFTEIAYVFNYLHTTYLHNSKGTLPQKPGGYGIRLSNRKKAGGPFIHANTGQFRDYIQNAYNDQEIIDPEDVFYRKFLREFVNVITEKGPIPLCTKVIPKVAVQPAVKTLRTIIYPTGVIANSIVQLVTQDLTKLMADLPNVDIGGLPFGDPNSCMLNWLTRGGANIDKHVSIDHTKFDRFAPDVCNIISDLLVLSLKECSEWDRDMACLSTSNITCLYNVLVNSNRVYLKKSGISSGNPWTALKNTFIASQVLLLNTFRSIIKRKHVVIGIDTVAAAHSHHMRRELCKAFWLPPPTTFEKVELFQDDLRFISLSDDVLLGLNSHLGSMEDILVEYKNFNYDMPIDGPKPKAFIRSRDEPVYEYKSAYYNLLNKNDSSGHPFQLGVPDPARVLCSAVTIKNSRCFEDTLCIVRLMAIILNGYPIKLCNNAFLNTGTKDNGYRFYAGPLIDILIDYANEMIDDRTFECLHSEDLTLADLSGMDYKIVQIFINRKKINGNTLERILIGTPDLDYKLVESMLERSKNHTNYTITYSGCPSLCEDAIVISRYEDIPQLQKFVERTSIHINMLKATQELRWKFHEYIFKFITVHLKRNADISYCGCTGGYFEITSAKFPGATKVNDFKNGAQLSYEWYGVRGGNMSVMPIDYKPPLVTLDGLLYFPNFVRHVNHICSLVDDPHIVRPEDDGEENIESYNANLCFNCDLNASFECVDCTEIGLSTFFCTSSTNHLKEHIYVVGHKRYKYNGRMIFCPICKGEDVTTMKIVHNVIMCHKCFSSEARYLMDRVDPYTAPALHNNTTVFGDITPTERFRILHQLPGSGSYLCYLNHIENIESVVGGINISRVIHANNTTILYLDKNTPGHTFHYGINNSYRVHNRTFRLTASYCDKEQITRYVVNSHLKVSVGDVLYLISNDSVSRLLRGLQLSPIIKSVRTGIPNKLAMPHKIDVLDKIKHIDNYIGLHQALVHDNLVVIEGIPGSGKSTVIADIIQGYYEAGLKVCVTAQSHAAVDAVAAKCARLNENGKLVCTRHKVITANIAEHLPTMARPNSPVVLITLASMPNLSLARADFDVCIVDECSLMSDSAFTAAISKMNPKQVIMVGDSKQIPTVYMTMDISADEANLYTRYCASFKRFYLNRSFRFGHDVAKLIQPFYKFPVSSAGVIKTTVSHTRICNDSFGTVYTAFLRTINFITNINRTSNAIKKVLITTPSHDLRSKFNNLIDTFVDVIKRLDVNIKAVTVNASQGDDADLAVFFVCQGSLGDRNYIRNVAYSRCKRYLHIYDHTVQSNQEINPIKLNLDVLYRPVDTVYGLSLTCNPANPSVSKLLDSIMSIPHVTIKTMGDKFIESDTVNLKYEPSKIFNTDPKRCFAFDTEFVNAYDIKHINKNNKSVSTNAFFEIAAYHPDATYTKTFKPSAYVDGVFCRSYRFRMFGGGDEKEVRRIINKSTGTYRTVLNHFIIFVAKHSNGPPVFIVKDGSGDFNCLKPWIISGDYRCDCGNTASYYNEKSHAKCYKCIDPRTVVKLINPEFMDIDLHVKTEVGKPTKLFEWHDLYCDLKHGVAHDPLADCETTLCIARYIATRDELPYVQDIKFNKNPDRQLGLLTRDAKKRIMSRFKGHTFIGGGAMVGNVPNNIDIQYGRSLEDHLRTCKCASVGKKHIYLDCYEYLNDPHPKIIFGCFYGWVYTLNTNIMVSTKSAVQYHSPANIVLQPIKTGDYVEDIIALKSNMDIYNNCVYLDTSCSIVQFDSFDNIELFELDNKGELPDYHSHPPVHLRGYKEIGGGNDTRNKAVTIFTDIKESRLRFNRVLFAGHAGADGSTRMLDFFREHKMDVTAVDPRPIKGNYHNSYCMTLCAYVDKQTNVKPFDVFVSDMYSDKGVHHFDIHYMLKKGFLRVNGTAYIKLTVGTIIEKTIKTSGEEFSFMKEYASKFSSMRIIKAINPAGKITSEMWLVLRGYHPSNSYDYDIEGKYYGCLHFLNKYPYKHSMITPFGVTLYT